MNGMMFTAVNWPPTCYVQEGAYWLALGRIPMIFIGDEEVDGRLDEESKWGGDVASFDPGFSEPEFAWIGHPIDYERYEAAPYLHDADFYERLLNRPLLEGETEEEREELHRRLMEDHQADKIEAEWHNEQDRAFDACVDDARAEIYRALSRGEIKAIGWLAYAASEIEQDGPPGRFVDIEPRRWSLRNFNWEESTLRSGSDEFRAVQIETDDLLKRFPKPSLEPLTMTVLAYPHGLVISEGIQEGPRRGSRPPGRIAKGGGVIRSVVQNYFGHRLRKGEGIKGEALIQEVIDFVAVAFPGEKISRSTVQDYLKAVRPTEDKDARSSEDAGNNAGNSAGK